MKIYILRNYGPHDDDGYFTVGVFTDERKAKELLEQYNSLRCIDCFSHKEYTHNYENYDGDKTYIDSYTNKEDYCEDCCHRRRNTLEELEIDIHKNKVYKIAYEIDLFFEVCNSYYIRERLHFDWSDVRLIEENRTFDVGITSEYITITSYISLEHAKELMKQKEKDILFMNEQNGIILNKVNDPYQ